MSEVLEFVIPPELGYMRELRRVIRERVVRLGVKDDRIDMLVLAVDEIVSNSIEHGNGYRVAGHTLKLELYADGGDLRLKFTDPDVPPDVVKEMRDLLEASRGHTPGFNSERGRGFFLMDDSLDEIRITRAADGGMEVRGRMAEVLG